MIFCNGDRVVRKNTSSSGWVDFCERHGVSPDSEFTVVSSTHGGRVFRLAGFYGWICSSRYWELASSPSKSVEEWL